MPNPKITVIIPTRERCDVLEASLRTVTTQAYDNLEIIVCDNDSGDDTADVVRCANDTRIRYLNTRERLSMSHNWEFALSHVDDGWVTFMGDDDGLMPASLQTVSEIIRETQTKAIRSTFCTYDWPGVAERPRGQLIVPLGSGFNTRDSAHWLSKVLHGTARYNQLPMIYNGGFTQMSVLKDIKERVGSFFNSASPDIFSAIAISKVTDEYVFTNEPLTIGGTSRHSNGNSAFSTSSQRNQNAYKQFMEEENIPLHKDIPAAGNGGFPISLQACVYEAYLQSSALDSTIGDVDHRQQLAVILATAGKHHQSIDEWGERFAQMHGLDFQTATHSASRKRSYLQSTAMTRKIINAFNSVIVETLPIRDIHEASIAAAVIRSAPSRMDSVRFLLGQTRSLFKHREHADMS